jgi:hypothetical protein
MQNQTKPHPLNNLSLKIIALVFGYTLWSAISAPQKVKITFQAPLSFFHEEEKTIDAPDHVSITLFGKRSEFYKLTRELAFHIDADLLSEGKNSLFLDKSQLYLPNSVKLVSCYPQKIKISVKENKQA